MVQDLGLKYVSTIRATAHWDSKKISPDGLNGGGMISTLSSTHFSAALPKLQTGIGFPLYLYHGSFTNCVKNGPRLAFGTGCLWFLGTFTHCWALRQTVGTSVMAPKPF